MTVAELIFLGRIYYYFCLSDNVARQLTQKTMTKVSTVPDKKVCPPVLLR